MITGKTPFYTPGDGVATVFLRHQLDAVPLMSSCVQNRPIPERVEALVQHLLAKDREQRPTRCADVARSFQEAVGELRSEQEIQPLLLDVPRGPLVRPFEIPPTSQTNPTKNAATAQLGADTVQSIAPTVVSQPSYETPKRRPLWLGMVALLALVPGAMWLGGVFSRTPPEPVLAPLVSAQAQEPSTSPAAASEPSQPAPSSASSPAPRNITLTLRSTPKGATVTLDGKLLGETPLETQIPAEERDGVLIFRKKQYEDETRNISLQANTTIDTKLSAKAGAKEPGRPKNGSETASEKPQTSNKPPQTSDPGKVSSDPNGTLQPAAFSKKKPR
jgi:serine/threonine-protein kinase